MTREELEKKLSEYEGMFRFYAERHVQMLNEIDAMERPAPPTLMGWFKHHFTRIAAREAKT